MLLRRLSEHVKAQNWLAVGLDFLIVVSGVFIGVQLGNWNSARADRAAYEDALERYRAEIEVNLQTIDDAEALSVRSLDLVGSAMDTLLACEDTEGALEQVNSGLNITMGTVGLSLRDSALQELVSSSRLLAQQSEEARRRFSDTAYTKQVFLREAEFVEMIPLEERAQNNPVVEIAAIERRQVNYGGADYSRPERRIGLAVPVSEACRNDQLIKSFYTWERWQGALPAINRILREQLESDLAWLDEQL